MGEDKFASEILNWCSISVKSFRSKYYIPEWFAQCVWVIFILHWDKKLCTLLWNMQITVIWGRQTGGKAEEKTLIMRPLCIISVYTCNCFPTLSIFLSLYLFTSAHTLSSFHRVSLFALLAPCKVTMVLFYKRMVHIKWECVYMNVEEWEKPQLRYR